MKLATISMACMAGYVRAFVGPSASLKSSFVQPVTRTTLSTLPSTASPTSLSCPQMGIAIVTVRDRGRNSMLG